MARSVKWSRFIPAVLAAIAIPFVIGYCFAVFVMFPKPKEQRGNDIPVPNLIGHTVSEADALLVSARLGSLDTMPLPHPSAPQGEILAQDPLPGQQLRPGANVRVSVSSGAPEIAVPDVTNLTQEAATQILRKIGFDTRETNEPGNAARGTITRVDPMPGTKLRLPATVTIAISSGAAPDTVQMMPDTIHPPQH